MMGISGLEMGQSALILIDLQNGFVKRSVGMSGMREVAGEGERRFLANVESLCDAMREADRPLVWLKTILRPDGLDSALSPLGLWGSNAPSAQGCLEAGTWGSQLTPELVPDAADFVVEKKGHSAFQFTSLDRLLENLGVNTCIMVGGGFSDSLGDSVRQGAALGYEIIIPGDATGYPSESAYILTLRNRASFTTTAKLVPALRSAGKLTVRPGKGDGLRGRPALLLVDLQNDFVDPQGSQHRLGYNPPIGEEDLASIISHNQSLLNAMRLHHHPIIYCVTTHRSDRHDAADPPASRRTKPVSEGQEYLLDGSWGAQIAAGLDVNGDDIIVTKKGRSAFGFTPLHRTLRNLGASRCIVTGGGVHGCVEDTVREGVGLGYSFTVVTDAVYEPGSPHLGVLNTRARLKTTNEVLAELQAPSGTESSQRSKGVPHHWPVNGLDNRSYPHDAHGGG